MLTFVIPVKSRSVTSNWISFSRQFEKTLRSIGNQTDSNFKIVVICHEIPDINYTHDDLHFIHPDFQPPSKENIGSKENLIKQRIDKGNKIKLGVDYARTKFNTDYVMLVDSDDYVSNRIAEFVNNSHDSPGWFIGRGYLSFKWKNVLIGTKKFNHLCGSSVIIKPHLVKYFFDMGKINLYFDHRLTTLNSNIELKKVPFCAGIYNMGNGENIQMSIQTVKKFSKLGCWISSENLLRIYRRIKNYRFRIITPALRKEFNFYPTAE